LDFVELKPAGGTAISAKYKTLVASTNITFTQTGSSVAIAAASGGNVAWNNSADTSANLDFLTDASGASGNTVSAKYKTLAPGSNVTFTQSGSVVYIAANGQSVSADGLTIYVDTDNRFTGNRVKAASATRSASGLMSLTLVSVHPIVMRYTGASIPAGGSLTWALSDTYTASNTYGWALTPYVQDDSVMSAYGKYLKATFSFTSAGVPYVTLYNDSSVAFSTVICFISFWTTANPSSIFVN
jgi:hypothetical protein